MMEFSQDKPIYRQIIDSCYARILSGRWQQGERVPSVRELAVEVAVNTHTVLKAYEFLQSHGIIVARRGLGFYLAPDAVEQVNAARREEFFAVTLPAVAAEMKLLGISIEEVAERIRQS